MGLLAITDQRAVIAFVDLRSKIAVVLALPHHLPAVSVKRVPRCRRMLRSSMRGNGRFRIGPNTDGHAAAFGCNANGGSHEMDHARARQGRPGRETFARSDVPPSSPAIGRRPGISDTCPCPSLVSPKASVLGSTKKSASVRSAPNK